MFGVAGSRLKWWSVNSSMLAGFTGENFLIQLLKSTCLLLKSLIILIHVQSKWNHYEITSFLQLTFSSEPLVNNLRCCRHFPPEISHRTSFCTGRPWVCALVTALLMLFLLPQYARRGACQGTCRFWKNHVLGMEDHYKWRSIGNVVGLLGCVFTRCVFHVPSGKLT